MGVLSIDQVRVFLAIVDRGSFSAAARTLRRHQSAISYAVLNLEQQLGVALFDRSGKMPRLTAAGAALLTDARKATYSLDTLKARAQSFARGVEAELAIAVDAFCPLEPLSTILREFGHEYPMVKPTLSVQLVGAAMRMVLEGTCALGLISHPMSTHKELEQFPTALSLELAAYVASSHPLAAQAVHLDSAELANHTQLLHAELSGLSLGQEFAVFSPRTWQSNDLRAQRELLLAGVGWGFMPSHAIADDVASGRLVQLELAAWPHGGKADVPMMVVRHADAALGPAASWLMDRLRGRTAEVMAAER